MPIDNAIQMKFGADRQPFLTRLPDVPDYSSKLPMDRQPQPVRHVSVDILDMSKPDDYAYYIKIWKAAGLGSVRVVEELKQWIEESKNWKVFIRWYIMAKMDPKELRTEVASATRCLVERAAPVPFEGDTGDQAS